MRRGFGRRPKCDAILHQSFPASVASPEESAAILGDRSYPCRLPTARQSTLLWCRQCFPIIALEFCSTPATAIVPWSWPAVDPIVHLSRYSHIPTSAACATSRCLQTDRINPCLLLLLWNQVSRTQGQESEFCWGPASESANPACADRGWGKSEKLFGKR